jgi:hypothetical protein
MNIPVGQGNDSARIVNVVQVTERVGRVYWMFICEGIDQLNGYRLHILMLGVKLLIRMGLQITSVPRSPSTYWVDRWLQSMNELRDRTA